MFLKKKKFIKKIEQLYKKECVGLQTQVIFKKPNTKFGKQSYLPHQDNSYAKNKNGLFSSSLHGSWKLRYLHNSPTYTNAVVLNFCRTLFLFFKILTSLALTFRWAISLGSLGPASLMLETRAIILNYCKTAG